MNPTNEQLNKTELENILGGAPAAVVEEFPKPGELSEDDLLNLMSGPQRAAIIDKEFEHEELFRRTSVEREKAAMFAELEQSSTSHENGYAHKK